MAVSASTNTHRRSHSAVQRLIQSYLLALSALALITLAGQCLMQNAWNRQENVSQFMILAGRQQALSQQIALTALALQAADTPAARTAKAQELQNETDAWDDDRQQLPLGGVVEPSYQAMRKAIQNIQAALPPDGSREKPDLARYLTPLLQNEARYRPGMEAVTTAYHHEAQAQASARTREEWGLLAVTALTLLTASALIFPPAVTSLREMERRTTEQNAALGEADRQLAEMRDVMENLSTVDTLTGLKNHRAFQEQIDSELGRAQRHGHSLSLLLLDVDRFKSYNDAYGHFRGDEALTLIGQVLKENARASDIPVRYGGEEFAVILTETDTMGAVVLGERIRQAIASADCLQRPLTASVGIATLTPGLSGVAELIAQADRALCHAKGEGRNRVSHVSRLPQPVEENWRLTRDEELVAA